MCVSYINVFDINGWNIAFPSCYSALDVSGHFLALNPWKPLKINSWSIFQIYLLCSALCPAAKWLGRHLKVIQIAWCINTQVQQTVGIERKQTNYRQKEKRGLGAQGRPSTLAADSPEDAGERNSYND